MIDSHCHLDAPEFTVDRASLLEQARAAGVRQWVVPAVTVDGFAGLKSCVAETPGAGAAYGLHPLYVTARTVTEVDIVADWLVREKPLAVGEIGLDYFVPDLDREAQQAVFEAQLSLARRHDLPVILHVRRAVDAVLRTLKKIPVQGGIAHAFNGSRQQADALIAQGFKLGMGGAMTFPGSLRIRELASTLPLSSLVLETDAPDIPPAWLGRQRNTPAELGRIAQVLADVRGISRAEVVSTTSDAARQALPGLLDIS